MTVSSYAANDLPENSPTAKRWQKHPRSFILAHYPRDYKKLKAGLQASKYPNITIVTLSATTISHLAAVNAVLGNLGTTNDASGSLTETYTYALVANPSGYFKVVGTAIQVAVALPTTGPIAISVSSTGALSGKTVTTPFSITLT